MKQSTPNILTFAVASSRTPYQSSGSAAADEGYCAALSAGNKLRLVAPKAISKVAVVWLVPARVGRGLSAAEARSLGDLAIALASHSPLLPASPSRGGAYDRIN